MLGIYECKHFCILLSLPSKLSVKPSFTDGCIKNCSCTPVGFKNIFCGQKVYLEFFAHSVGARLIQSSHWLFLEF